MTVLYLLLWGQLFIAAASYKSSMKARIHPPALSFIIQIGKQVLSEEVRKMQLPEYRRNFRIGSAKMFELSVADFESPSFFCDRTNNGLQCHSIGGKLSLRGKVNYWVWVIFKIQETWRMQIDISGMNSNFTAKLVNLNGRPQIIIGSCSFGLSHIKVSASSQIRSRVRDAVDEVIRSKVCELAREAIVKEVNQKIQNMSNRIPLSHGFAVDYSLDRYPMHTKDYIDANIQILGLQGGRLCTQNNRRGDWNNVVPGTHMITLWLGEYLARCFASTAHDLGKLKYLVTKEVEQAKDYLRTTCPLLSICAGMFFEELEEKYPDQYVNVLLYSYKTAPETRFDRNGIWIQATVAADVCIIGQCAQKEVLARIVFDVNGYVHPVITNNNITGSISNLTISAQEEFSNIGHIGEEFLSMMTGPAFFPTIVQAINAQLQQGLTIPSFNFRQFTIKSNAELTVLDGVLRLNLDFTTSK